EKLAGFDEQYVNGCEDIDFCLRAAAAGHVNVVALRSQVRHHISRSPGRKLHDEQNTRRLMLHWRDTLARLAARRWCWDYLRREWTRPRTPVEVQKAVEIFAHATRLRSRPPDVALEGMQLAIERELARWERMEAE